MQVLNVFHFGMIFIFEIFPHFNDFLLEFRMGLDVLI